MRFFWRHCQGWKWRMAFWLGSKDAGEAEKSATKLKQRVQKDRGGSGWEIMAVQSEIKQAVQHTESKQPCACSSWDRHGSMWEGRVLCGEWVTGLMKRTCPEPGGTCRSFTTGLRACVEGNNKGDMFFLTKISVHVWPSWDYCFFVFLTPRDSACCL